MPLQNAESATPFFVSVIWGGIKMTDNELSILQKNIYRLYRHTAALNLSLNTGKPPGLQHIQDELSMLKKHIADTMGNI